MSEIPGIVVMGASGRMGQMLTRNAGTGISNADADLIPLALGRDPHLAAAA